MWLHLPVSSSFIPQLKNNFEIDPEAAEKIIIRQEDFHHALEHDIKPVSRTIYWTNKEAKTMYYARRYKSNRSVIELNQTQLNLIERLVQLGSV